MVVTIQRRPQVMADSGQSRSTLYKNIKQGLWTKPVRIGPRAVGWPSTDTSILNAARVAGKSDTEIKLIVKQLMEQRKTFSLKAL